MLARKSIKATATALGCTEGAISQWELGMSSPSIQTLEELASFYDMPMDTMLDRPGAPMSPYEWYARSVTESDVSRQKPWGDVTRTRRSNAPQGDEGGASQVRYRDIPLPRSFSHPEAALAGMSR